MIVAPYSSSSARRSGVAFDGITHVSFRPFSFATSASEMPVLPLVGSSSSWPGSRSAASTIASATRSLIEPGRVLPLELRVDRAARRRELRQLDQRGVPDQVEQRASGTATGHRRQQDDGRAVAHRRVEAVAGAHVLAVDVDVHERLDLAVAVDARAERGDARRQILEQLAHGRAGGLDLARAARLRAQHRRDPDDVLTCAQNST